MIMHSFGKQEFILGLNWDLSHGAASHAIQLLKNQTGLNHGIIRKIWHDNKSYNQIALTKSDLKGKHSAAVLLAKATKQCFLIEDINEHELWICAIDHGLIIPGFDVVVSKAMFEDFLDDLKNIPGGLLVDTIHINTQDNVLLSVLQEKFPDKTIKEAGFDKLTEGCNPRFINRIAKLYDPRLKYAMISVVLLFFCIVLYLFWPASEKDPENYFNAEFQANAYERLTQQLKEDKSQLYLKAKKEEKQWLQRIINSSHPNYLLARIIQLFNDYPKYVQGYELTEVNYSWHNPDMFPAPATVNITWNVIDGNIKSALNAWKKQGIAVKQTNNTQSFVTTHTITEYARTADEAVEKNEPLKSVAQNALDFLDYFQYKKQYVSNIAENDLGERFITIEGTKEKTRQFKYKRLKFTLSARYLYQLANLEYFFNQHPICTITKLNIKKTGAWSLEGYMYEN